MTLNTYLINYLQFLILIPSAVLCYIPMKNQLKYSFKKIFLQCAVIFLITSPLCAFLFCFFEDLEGNTIIFPFIILFFLYYNHTLKAAFSNSLSVFIFSCTILSFICNLSYAFDAYLYPDSYYLNFSLEATFFKSLSSVVIIAILFFPLKKYGSRLIDNLQISLVWYLTIPVSIIILGLNNFMIPHYYSTLKNERLFRLYLFFEFSLFMLYIFLLILFYFISQSILSSVKMAERQRFFEMQENQYLLLKKHMQDIRKLRHDLRQSIHVINTLTKQKDYESIEKYISEYEKELPTIEYTKYCNNNAVDALLNYYAQQETENNIKMNWNINLTEITTISETDLCSLIGNLIENSIYGCMTIPPLERKHSLTILTKGNKLYIVSTNTFDGIVKKVNDKYISTKKAGNSIPFGHTVTNASSGRGKGSATSQGIGISSICITAEKYEGIAKFHNTDNEFCADVMLIIP